MKSILLILVTAFFQYSLVYSQNEAHRLIKERIALKNIPGIAFLVSKDGKIVDEGYYGRANLEIGAEVTHKSVFAIASMSKTYTAAAILIMAEQGLLKLDDTVKKYIPEVPESWNTITIKHLLTHSSGLVDDWALYDWNKSNQLFLQTQTDSLFLKHLFMQELLFEPGSSHSYSCGPFVLGIIMEKITGKNYEEFLKKNIFEPLNLKETFVDNPYKIIPNRVSGYFNYDSNKINSRVSGIGNGMLLAPVAYGRADVGIRTTARDLMKFYNALLTEKLINEDSKKIMFNPSTLDNGNFIPTTAGWMNWPLGGLSISEHSGGFRTGFNSQAFIVPKDNFVIILFSNLNGGVNFPLTQEIAGLYYPELEQLSKKTPANDTKTELTELHLNFLQEINTAQENEPVLNKVFPFSYYSKKLKESISGTESIEYLGERNVENEKLYFFDVRIHSLRFYKLNSRKTFYTTVYLDRDDKIVFVDYPETE